jgi:cytochrome P450
VISDFADPLPSWVLAEMLGLPNEDSNLICKWSKHLFQIFDPLSSLNLCVNSNQVAQECAEYFQSYIAQRRQKPQSDLISALVTVEKDGETLSDQEILSTCMMIVTAGMATTAAIIGNGMLALLRHPEQLELLKNHPEIWPTATEELMRYDSPTQLVARTPDEIVEMGGKIMKPGDNIILYIGAANRDPEKFTEPDRLNLMRIENPHIAFAVGIHLCVGAALARLEVPIAINTLVQKLPTMKLAIDKFEYHDYLVLRYLKSLLVTFES